MTDRPPIPDTSTRRALEQHLDDTDQQLQAIRRELAAGTDPADLMSASRQLRYSAGEVATMTAYARAIRGPNR